MYAYVPRECSKTCHNFQCNHLLEHKIGLIVVLECINAARQSSTERQFKRQISAYWWQLSDGHKIQTCENEFFGHRILTSVAAILSSIILRRSASAMLIKTHIPYSAEYTPLPK